MTQTSYFHNGAWSGDAINAPYRATTFAEVFRIMRSPSQSVVFNYLNNLAVTVSGAVVSVNTGACMVGGVYIENTTSANITMIPGPTASSNTRIDRVVARVEWNTHTVNFYIKQGRSSPQPEPPELVQLQGEVYEMPLASLYVVANAVTLTNADVWDERKFFEDSQHKAVYATKNLMPNSEQILGVGSGGDGLPAHWISTSVTPPTLAGAEKFDQQARGNSTIMTFNTFHSENARCGCQLYSTSQSGSIPYTVRFVAQVLQGQVRVQTGGAGSVSKTLQPSAEPMEFIIRDSADNTHPFLLLTFDRQNSTGLPAIIRIGQVTCSYGYVGVGMVPNPETILVSGPPILLASRTNVDSQIITVILDRDIPYDFDVGFVESVLIRIDYSDSQCNLGASRGIVRTGFAGLTGGDMTVDIGLAAANSEGTEQGWIPIALATGGIYPFNDPSFEVDLASPGPFSIDCDIYLLGVKT